MRQSGLPFTRIPTVRAMLETVFDIFEVLRFLRRDRQVLHRDISSGNIMYINPPQGITAQKGEVLPVLAKYLLGERYVSGSMLRLGDDSWKTEHSTNPRETSAHFKHAEHLESKHASLYRSRCSVWTSTAPLHRLSATYP
ncbi:hypothetical protein M407DRAFT_187789 [Tulasnella calospora MUT 4182]|uniref:Protein kinase domain-containing protein n=1 Tax=Tulasnella calospora MUT 4182 TaxID=1051891 RepID=A0A0C3M2D4_9AGAM|nr:hypothetical protein M407DRAFT_187789 [Tulasnella calospora MUT 4182]